MALVPKQIHQLLNIAWYIWCSYSLERGALRKGFVVACRHQAPPNKSCSAAGSAHCLSVVTLLCGHQELGLKGYKPSWLDCVYSRRITLKPLASAVKILVEIAESLPLSWRRISVCLLVSASLISLRPVASSSDERVSPLPVPFRFSGKFFHWFLVRLLP